MAFRLVGYGPRGTVPETFSLGRRKQYPTALRKAVSDLLGPDVRRVEIFQGERLVAVCGLDSAKVRGGNKYLVRCSGEKPSKAARARATKAFKAARERRRRANT